jgi:hypothetical protein
MSTGQHTCFGSAFRARICSDDASSLLEALLATGFHPDTSADASDRDVSLASGIDRSALLGGPVSTGYSWYPQDGVPNNTHHQEWAHHGVGVYGVGV